MPLHVFDPVAHIPEKELGECVRQLAKALGLLRYHTFRSDRSPEGFPDEAIIRGDTLLLYELKAEKGKLTPAQIRWLDALSRVTRVESGVWRPTQWVDGTIELTLRGGR